MSKKKVLILGKLPPPYMGPSIGTEIMLRSALNDHFELLHLNTKANYTIKTMGKWSFYKLMKNIMIYFDLSRIIRRKKPDLILIPISQTTLGFVKDSFFLIISKVFKKKMILHFLGGDFKEWVERSSPATRIYVKRILSFSKGVIVLGNNLKYHFEKYFTDERIFVIPNGANYTIPARTASQNHSTRIIWVSSLMVSKGIEDVLQALTLLKKERMQMFDLKIVGSWGDDRLRDRCLQWIAEHQLPVEFSLPGVSNEIKLQELSNADIFVFTPREQEGQPWVIVEAMAAGLPVISTDRGAIAEAVRDQQNGFIVERYAAQQIAEKIKYLMSQPEIKKTMGNNSRKIYLDNYTEDKMVAKFKDCFNKLLEA